MTPDTATPPQMEAPNVAPAPSLDGAALGDSPCWASSPLAKLPCLSIRQPWAQMILRYGKDIENRSWRTRFRGQFLIHASKGMTKEEWCDAVAFKNRIGATPVGEKIGVDPVTIKTVKRGGIVGVAHIVDCVSESKSPWFVGEWGFVLADVQPLDFLPCKGSLGFFYLPNISVSGPCPPAGSTINNSRCGG